MAKIAAAHLGEVPAVGGLRRDEAAGSGRAQGA